MNDLGNTEEQRSGGTVADFDIGVGQGEPSHEGDDEYDLREGQQHQQTLGNPVETSRQKVFDDDDDDANDDFVVKLLQHAYPPTMLLQEQQPGSTNATNPAESVVSDVLTDDVMTTTSGGSEVVTDDVREKNEKHYKNGIGTPISINKEEKGGKDEDTIKRNAPTTTTAILTSGGEIVTSKEEDGDPGIPPHGTTAAVGTERFDDSHSVTSDMTAQLAVSLRPATLTEVQHVHRNNSSSNPYNRQSPGAVAIPGRNANGIENEEPEEENRTEGNQEEDVVLVPEAEIVTRESEGGGVITEEMKERLRQDFLREHTNNLIVAEQVVATAANNGGGEDDGNDEENQLQKTKNEEHQQQRQRRTFIGVIAAILVIILIIIVIGREKARSKGDSKRYDGQGSCQKYAPPTPLSEIAGFQCARSTRGGGGGGVGVSGGTNLTTTTTANTTSIVSSDGSNYTYYDYSLVNGDGSGVGGDAFVLNRFNGNNLLPNFYKYPREYYPFTPVPPTTVYPKILPLNLDEDDDEMSCYLRLTSEDETVPYDTVTSIMSSYRFSSYSSEPTDSNTTSLGGGADDGMSDMAFTTSFAYRIYSTEGALHPNGNGLAFVMHQDVISGGRTALGNPGHGNFGVYTNEWLDPTSDEPRISPALIVELDTVQNTEASDQNGSSNLHVQMTKEDGKKLSLYESRRGTVTIRTDVAQDDGDGTRGDDILNEERHGRVWIEYTRDASNDGASSRPMSLKIYLNSGGDCKPEEPQAVLGSDKINLSELFDPTKEVYVGWTSSVNGIGPRDNHDILSWTGILEEGIQGRKGSPPDGGNAIEPAEQTPPQNGDGSNSRDEDESADKIYGNINAYEYKYVDDLVRVDSIMKFGDKIEVFNSGENIEEGPQKMFDNTTSKFFYRWSHSPNDNIDNAIILTPSLSSCTILQGITFYVANDSPERDWREVRLEGRKTFNTTDFQLIQHVIFDDLPNGRNEQYESLNPDKHVHQTIMFEDNMEAYIQYRIVIETTKGSLSTQVGELLLPGLLCPKSYISDSTESSNGDDNNVDGTGVEGTIGPAEGEDATAIASGLNFTSDDGSVWLHYDNLLSPNDRIEMVGSTSRIDRDVRNLIDGLTDKTILYPSAYKQDPVDLNFVSDFSGGFQILPNVSPCTVVQGMTIFMSNHYIGRDPTSYELEGRHVVYDEDGTVETISPYEVISKGSFHPPAERNKDSQMIELGKHSHVSLVINNTKPYTQYRVVFPTIRGFPIVYSSRQQAIELQLSEIWFSGYTCPIISNSSSNPEAMGSLPPPPTNPSDDGDDGSSNLVLPPPSLTSFPDAWMWKESILQYGDPVQHYGGGNHIGETVFELYDGTTNKWVVIIHPNIVPGMDVIPTISPYTIIQGLTFFPANDFPYRDPIKYTFEGRNLPDHDDDDSDDNDNDRDTGYVMISEGELSLPEGRNQPGTIISDDTIDSLSKFRVDFVTNEIPYQQYRLLFQANSDLTFPTKETFAESLYSLVVQLAEVQFHGYALVV